MGEIRIAFIDIVQFDNVGMRGGVLITDAATEPIEFRCTSIVRPTTLQQVLWGDRLQAHVASRIIAKPMLSALTNAPGLVVIRKPEFMELREDITSPVVQVLKNEELNLTSPHAAESNNGLLQCDGNRFDPVVLRVHRRFGDDFSIAKDVLGVAHQSCDILEPFNRILRALELVHEQEANPRKKT